MELFQYLGGIYCGTAGGSALRGMGGRSEWTAKRRETVFRGVGCSCYLLKSEQVSVNFYKTPGCNAKIKKEKKF